MNGVLLALLLAQAAADAGVGADAHGSLALVLVGAGHVDLLGHRDLRDQMAGAGLGAGHAVGALVRVHHGGAVGTDGHGAELAGGHAGAEAQTAELALQRTTGHLGGRQAVLHTDVLITLGGVSAAVAADKSHLPLTGGSLLAHDLCDGGSILRAGRGARIHRSRARQDGGGTAGAAGEAAAAAVGAGQMAEDFLFPGVLLYLKDLGGYCQDEAEHGAEDSQHHNGSNDISDIHFPLQTGEAHKRQGHQTSGDQGDGKALKRLGIVRKHQPLPNAGEQHDGQQEAQAAGDAVNYGGDEVIVVLHVQQHHTQYGAVGGNQGQIHTQSRVQRRHGFL